MQIGATPAHLELGSAQYIDPPNGIDPDSNIHQHPSDNNNNDNHHSHPNINQAGRVIINALPGPINGPEQYNMDEAGRSVTTFEYQSRMEPPWVPGIGRRVRAQCVVEGVVINVAGSDVTLGLDDEGEIVVSEEYITDDCHHTLVRIYPVEHPRRDLDSLAVAVR